MFRGRGERGRTRSRRAHAPARRPPRRSTPSWPANTASDKLGAPVVAGGAPNPNSTRIRLGPRRERENRKARAGHGRGSLRFLPRRGQRPLRLAVETCVVRGVRGRGQGDGGGTHPQVRFLPRQRRVSGKPPDLHRVHGKRLGHSGRARRGVPGMCRGRGGSGTLSAVFGVRWQGIVGRSFATRDKAEQGKGPAERQ